MILSRAIGGTYGIPAGGWRWAALGLGLIALLAAGLAVAAPLQVGWAGVVLVAGIGGLAALLFVAVWPRQSLTAANAKRMADAAARANVAWAITAKDGAVLDCNDVYRRMTRVSDGE